MNLLDWLKRNAGEQGDPDLLDLTGDASIAICHALRKAAGPAAPAEPEEPCPICGRGTAKGHRHVEKKQEDRAGVVPIRAKW